MQKTRKLAPEELKHQVFNLTLSLLENKRIRTLEAKKNSSFLLHPKAKVVLKEVYRFSDMDIENLEKSVREYEEEQVFGEVVSDVPRALYQSLKKLDETETIFTHRIVPLPNAIENAIICQTLERRFSSERVLNCDGFIEVEWMEELNRKHSSIRLNIAKRIVRNGFILPVYQNGLICAFRIFRYPDDERPFILGSRGIYFEG